MRLVGHPTSETIQQTREALSVLEEARARSLRAEGTPRPADESLVLTAVRLRNVGPFESADIDLANGWNVLLGNNGCGKSSVLKAIALASVATIPRLRRQAHTFFEPGASSGSIELQAGADVYRTELVRLGGRVTVSSPRLTPLQTARWVVLGFPSVRGVSSRAHAGIKRRHVEADVRDLLPIVAGAVDTRLDSIKQWLINLHVQTRRSPVDRERSERLRDAFFKFLNEITPGAPTTFDHIDEKTWQVMVKTIDAVVPLIG